MTGREEQADWIDRLARLVGSFGFNPIRVRWKLERLRQRLVDGRLRAGQRVEQIGYRHKVCPRCGRVNDRGDDVCAGCGCRLGGWLWHALGRIGVGVPAVLSVSSLLGLAMVAVYARLALYQGGPESIFAFDPQTLVHFGGHWPAAVRAGEWWRLGTAIFLHMGLWHLGFNLLALAQVGPAVEELFGRGRMLLFFLVTGILANLVSGLFGLEGVAIGASGAIMGLCGLVAGWGQRDGTRLGRGARNRMLKWAGYTVVFGLFIGADNVAHLAGFAAGGLVGLLIRPDHLRRTERLWLRSSQSLLGLLAATGLVIACLLPPASPFEARFARLAAPPAAAGAPSGPGPQRPSGL